MRDLPLLALMLLVAALIREEAMSQVVPPPPSTSGLERFAKQIEPDLQGRPERLPQYVAHFRAQAANDPRLVAFHVEPTIADDGRVTLVGFVEYPETRSGLQEYLELLGFADIDNRLETLPAATLGDKRYGVVKTTHALSYDRPQRPREVVTDCLFGEPLYLLREDGDHVLVHSGEGYLGYVAAAAIECVGRDEFDAYVAGPHVRMIADHAVDKGLTLPVGAILKVQPGDAGVCELPTGATVAVPAEKRQPVEPPAAEIEQAIAAAVRLLETPYHWGGKTAAGIDCSGLVQIAFASIGFHLPRDANQQFYLGRLTATRWHRAGLRRGDTLYFISPVGKISHTGLYLGDDRFVHAELPQVKISSFNPEHDQYDPKRDASFAFAKRLW